MTERPEDCHLSANSGPDWRTIGAGRGLNAARVGCRRSASWNGTGRVLALALFSDMAKTLHEPSEVSILAPRWIRPPNWGVFI